MPRTTSVGHPRRRPSILWAGGGLAAAVLLLGVSGTLSSWTSAIITNNDNTTSSADAVRLVETSGGQTCDSGTSLTNSALCSQINKYGGTGSPMSPGDVHHVEVLLTNSGTAAGLLSLAPDTCTSAATASGPHDADACDAFTVHLACVATSDDPFDSDPSTLTAFPGGDIATLQPGDSADCTFDVGLPADTLTIYAGQVAAQTLQWTLTHEVV
jgi:hypothetical protein